MSEPRTILRIRPGLDHNADVLVELDLARPLVVGRGLDSDLILVNSFISRRHARFLQIDGEVYIEDLGSVNGIEVAGFRISRRTKVAPGDSIQIGPLFLRIEIGQAEQSVRVTQGQPRVVPLEAV